MKHQMILVVHADDVKKLMEFQQQIVYAADTDGVSLRKVEIKPVDPRD